MNRAQKAATIDALAEELAGAQAVIAVDFRGLDVAGTERLRTRLREEGNGFRVVKNSLTERAAAKAGLEVLSDFLVGPTALAFAYRDPVAAAKAIAQTQREKQLLPFKGGVMGGRTVGPGELEALAKLPAREVLYSQLAGMVAHPLAGLGRTLQALLGGLAVALGQLKEQKEGAAS